MDLFSYEHERALSGSNIYRGCKFNGAIKARFLGPAIVVEHYESRKTTIKSQFDRESAPFFKSNPSFYDLPRNRSRIGFIVNNFSLAGKELYIRRRCLSSVELEYL